MNLSKVSTLLASAIFVSAVALHGQSGQLPSSNPQTPTNQNGIANNANLANDPSSPANLADRSFLHKAAEGGLAEVQLGQLASQKGSTDDVKAFGQRMVTDHTQLNEQLKPFAQQKNAGIPKKLSKKDQALYDRLNGLSGDAFDKAYLQAMMKDHHEDIKDFKTEASTTTDPQLKAAVEKGEQVIEQHMTAVQQLAKQKGVDTASTGGQ